MLMTPGLPYLNSVRAVCQAAPRPINLIVGIPGEPLTFAELEAALVQRLSLATTLNRAAIDAMVTAAEEVRDDGTFEFVETGPPSPFLAS